ncbi:MAG: MFS transporter [Litoreibacter sp.]
MNEPTASMQDLASRPPDICRADARKFILFSAILASSLGFIDGSMVSIALPSIREALNGSLAQAQWISNGYLLPLAALLLVGGAIGDRFGLARVFAFGISVFVLASVGCIISPSAEFMIGSRVVQGIGAAFMIPGSLALISRTYPPSERGRAIGIWAASSAVTSALGPIIGGLVLSFGNEEAWRTIFAINLPLGGAALFLLKRNVQNDPAQPDRGVDVTGAALATFGLGTIAVALTGMGDGSVFGFNTTLMALIGMMVLGFFIFAEHISPHPMLPLNLFSDMRFLSANILSFLIYFSFSAVLFYLPMTLVGAWGEPEINTAAAYAPLSIFIALLSGPAGKLSDRYSPCFLLITGSFILAVGYAALAFAIPTQDFWGRVLPAMVCQGIGMGLVVAPVSNVIMGSVTPSLSGTASGVNNAVTRIAGLLAVASMGYVVSGVYTASNGPESYGALAPSPEHAIASNAAFVRVCIIASVSCAIAMLFACVWRQDPNHGNKDKPTA